MVAIPTLLLASVASSWSGRRSAEPELAPAPGPFNSVLGPVVTVNFPDPAILHVNDTSYAFATNNRGIGNFGLIHIQVATSKDNQTWEYQDGHDALPTVGAWETGERIWAPDVIQLDDGTFVMYYAGTTQWSPEHHCIGAATSNSPMGPYEPLDTPLACPDVHTQGGAIDPDGFLDPSTGRRYVTYKVDGNSIGHGGICKNTVEPIVPTPILLQEVDVKDGLTLIGDPVEILDRDYLDGPLIEAPSLYRSDEGIYFLFFSSNCFTTPKYDVSFATATSITGPYLKSQRPLLATGDGPELIGPGGTDIVKGGTLILFHGHLTPANMNGDLASIQPKSQPNPGRRSLLSRITGRGGQKSPVGKSVNTTPPSKREGPPLVRGMYSAVATFSGRNVLLTGDKPGVAV